MTSAQRRSLIALAFGVIVALILRYFLPGASVWLYVGVGVLAAAGGYQGLLKQDALHKIADK